MRQAKKQLTEKQKLFVSEYLKDQNATRAYLRAGYKVSQKVAQVNGARMLSIAMVQAAIQARLDKRLRKVEITADSVLEELHNVAFTNLLDFIQIDEDGSPRSNLKDVTREQAAALLEINFDEVIEGSGADIQKVRKVKIKLHDKLRSLQMIGSYIKLFSDSQQRVTEASAKVLRQVRDGQMTVEEGSYEFAILGLPLPEILKSKLAALEALPLENQEPLTTEMIMARKAEMERNIEDQKERFLPERRAEVAATKEANKNRFDQQMFDDED